MLKELPPVPEYRDVDANAYRFESKQSTKSIQTYGWVERRAYEDGSKAKAYDRLPASTIPGEQAVEYRASNTNTFTEKATYEEPERTISKLRASKKRLPSSFRLYGERLVSTSIRSEQDQQQADQSTKSLL